MEKRALSVGVEDPREALDEIAADSEWEVTTVRSVERAFERLQESSYDWLIVADDGEWQSGLERVQRVYETGHDLPTVILQPGGPDDNATYVLPDEQGGSYRRRPPADDQSESSVLVEALADPLFCFDERGRISSVNEAFERATGTSRRELLGAAVDDVVGEVPTGVDDRTFEVTLTNGGGTDRRFEGRVSRLPDRNDHGGVCVLRDVTERLEETARLRDLVADLETERDSLEEFARVVAHDLRGPLQVASGNLELLDAPGASDDEARQRIENSLQRMERLIDDVLTLARRGDVVDETEVVDLASLARTCWETVDTDGARLVVRPMPKIVADRGRVRELFENLYRNAVEHGSTGSRTRSDDAVEHGSTSSRTPSDDAVEHGSTGNQTRSDGAVEHPDSDVTIDVGPVTDGFYVADDGPGIPEDERDAVFEAGYTTTDDGTGFGLNIVERIAVAHGWDVVVTESARGGARFEFHGVDVADEPSS